MYSCLLVEDEPIVLKALQIIIEQSGLPIGEISAAGDGEEACKQLENRPYDIVLTDIRMPKMDGLELCRIVCSNYPETAVLIVTGYEDFKYAHKAIKYGVKDYILKPVTREGIVNSISKVIEGMKEKRAFPHVPVYEIEKVADFMADELWNTQEPRLHEGVQMLFEKLEGMSGEYCKTVSQDVIELVKRKMAKRMNHPFEVQFESSTAADCEGVRDWLGGLLEEIRLELVRFKSNAYYNIVDTARLYIADHLEDNITLEDTAKQVGMAPTYFSQIFSESTGQTFVRFRTEMRMKKAMEFLCRPDMSVKEIAFKVGYNDENHFTRSFKKYTGITPTKFREKRGIG